MVVMNKVYVLQVLRCGMQMLAICKMIVVLWAGVRDYIHVVDLAQGHVAAVRKLDEQCGLKVSLRHMC